ncbi:MAG TPA: serine hydrolase domain-containing protein [Micromonosporaceae bacterium]|nr:serine hydrolase domain-containing protein [Micromonosporaceae bacterium]
MPAHLTDSGVARLHDAMAQRVARRELPGLVTMVACGDAVHVDPIGTVAFDSDAPMRRDTLFRIASLTKPIVAAATMLLVEEGRIRLDDPVDRLLPELADRRVLRRIDGPTDDTVPANRSISVDDLLTLRLGFGQITEPEFNPPYPIVHAADSLDLTLGAPDPRTPHAPDEWMRLFGSLPLMDQPGERWRYNVGTLVLGVLVARAGGATLGDVLRDRLFGPLGMVDTGFETTPEDAARMPTQYMSDQATGKLAAQTLTAADTWTSPPAFPSGSGGLLSTIDDLHAFARMLRDGGRHHGQQILSAASVEAMTTNHLSDDQISSAGLLLGNQGWGYGMAVVTRPTDNGLTPGQYGWSGGYGTTWFNDPSRDLIAIALTQTSDFLWNGGLDEFDRLAVGAVEPGDPDRDAT